MTVLQYYKARMRPVTQNKGVKGTLFERSITRQVDEEIIEI